MKKTSTFKPWKIEAWLSNINKVCPTAELDQKHKT